MKHYLLLLVISFLTSCGDDEKSDPTAPNYLSTTISGITMTDVNGSLFGTVDQSDWGTSDLFSPTLVAKFNFSDTLDYSDADTGIVQLGFFPNPTTQLSSLYIDCSNPAVCKLIVTDNNLNVFTSTTVHLNDGNNLFVLNFDDSLFTANHLYRIYYQFYDAQKVCFARGHGDLKKD